MSDYDDTRYDDDGTRLPPRRPKRGWRIAEGIGAFPRPPRRPPDSVRWDVEDDPDLFGPDRDAWPDWRP